MTAADMDPQNTPPARTTTSPYHLTAAPSNISTTHSAVDEAAGLCSIAQEVFEMITAHLNFSDLRNLRLVSSETNVKVIDTFAKARFAKYSLLLDNRDSLETAYKVAAHPTFSPAIRKLTIFVDQLGVRQGRYLPDKMAWIMIESLRSSAVLVPKSGDLFFQVLDRAYGTVTTDPSVQHGQEETFDMLTSIFSALVSLSNVEEVEIAVHVNERKRQTRLVSKAKQFRRGLGHFGYFVPDADDEWPLTVVAKAMWRSGFTTKSLDINTNKEGPWYDYKHQKNCDASRYWGLSVEAVSTNLNLLEFFKHTFKTLEKVELNLWADATCVERADVVASMLAAAPVLKVLTIKAPQKKGDDVEYQLAHFVDALLHTTLPNLEHLSLKGLEVQLPALLSFNQRHGRLERLDFDKVKLLSCAGIIKEKMSSAVLFDEQCMWGDNTDQLAKALENELREVCRVAGEYNHVVVVE